MSLIISRRNTLKTTAIVTLPYIKGSVIEEKLGDLVLIKVKNKVVGLNILNFKKYFEAKEGAHTINNAQIEAIKKLGYNLKTSNSMFSIGEIIERKIHHKSGKLYILKVKTNKIITIVTNIENAIIGNKVVVANVGATLPSGVTILHFKVMNIISEGMLCSRETLDKEDAIGPLMISGKNGDEYIL